MNAKKWLRKLVGGVKASPKAPRTLLNCEPLEERVVPVGAISLDVTNGVLTYTSSTSNNNLTAGLDNANPANATNYIFSDQNTNITLTNNATLAGWFYPDGSSSGGSDGAVVEGPKTYNNVTINSIVINAGIGSVTLGLNGNLTPPASANSSQPIFIGAAADAAIMVQNSNATPIVAGQILKVLGEILAPTGNVTLDAANINVAANQSILTGDQTNAGSGNITLNANIPASNITVAANATVATGNASSTGSGGGDTGSINVIGTSRNSCVIILDGSLSTGNQQDNLYKSGSINVSTATTNNFNGSITANGTLTTGSAVAGSGNIAITTSEPALVGGTLRTGNSTHSGSINLSAGATGLTINGTLVTGDATQTDTTGSDTPTSGNITLNSSNAVKGSGTLSTGNASLTGIDQAGTDVVTSGSISVTSGPGSIGLSASPAALVIGTASRIGTTADTALAGTISLNAGNSTISGSLGNATVPLLVTTGVASGATTNTPGLLTASTSGNINILATAALIAGNISGNNITLGAPAPITLGDGTANTETLRSNGTFLLSAGGYGVTIATNGVLAGSGAVGTSNVNDPLTNAGVIQVGGTGAGTITVNGNYTQTGNGTLDVQLGGTTAGTSYSQLSVTGTAKLGGTLNVSLINSFSPSSGNTFNVLAFNSRLVGSNNLPSDFATKNFNGQTLQAAYNGSYAATLLTLEYLTVTASDVTSSFSVTRAGASVNTTAKTITQTVTVTNTSSGSISGPVYLVVNPSSSNFALANAAGVTVQTSPAGQSYVVLSLSNLAAGASVSFTLVFNYQTTPAGFGYTTHVLAGGNP